MQRGETTVRNKDHAGNQGDMLGFASDLSEIYHVLCDMVYVASALPLVGKESNRSDVLSVERDCAVSTVAYPLLDRLETADLFGRVIIYLTGIILVGEERTPCFLESYIEGEFNHNAGE